VLWKELEAGVSS